ncbi:TRAP transporter small permease [Bacillus sp. B15-48]|uniref:TRAP transporter small permease n=1 Tax=Bacillus sp. B15-48 TaxID=1548601 RepID=UPI00194016B8|nr:TRAP transporter small permease [Bacillus sp. B15-48]
MTHFIKMVDVMNKGIKVIIGVFLAIMAIVIFTQVILRFFFGGAFNWAEELSRYLMVWSIFLGAAVALRTQSLIALEFVAEKLSTPLKRKLKIFVFLGAITFFIILFVMGIQMMGNVQFQKSPALQISMSIPYLGIPVGSAALLLNAVAVLFELILNKTPQESEGIS